MNENPVGTFKHKIIKKNIVDHSGGFRERLFRTRDLVLAHAVDDRTARYQMCAETTDPSRVRSPHGAARWAL